MVGRGLGVALFLLAAGCAGTEQGLVKPSALDPGLAVLDGEQGRELSYPVVAIDRFDGFLEEAARVEATVELARRLGGELRAEVVQLATEHDVPRADERPWTALARELAARDLSAEERARLGEAVDPLLVLMPHLGRLTYRTERLIAEGETLFDGAHEELTGPEHRRLARALDALNVSLAQLRDARNRGPRLAAELAIGLGELARFETKVQTVARGARRPDGDG